MDLMREMIEQRAYLLYLKRGKINGHHEEDWKQAEKEIHAELEAKKKAEVPWQAPAPKPEVKAPPAAPVKAPVAKTEPVKPAAKATKKRK